MGWRSGPNTALAACCCGRGANCANCWPSRREAVMSAESETWSEREQRLQEALLAYFRAVDAGEHPLAAEYVTRYPDLAAELEAFFADQQELVPRVAPLRRTPATVGARSPDHAPTARRRFGDYELLEEVARGGMGVVYKARQVSLNRVVALKMVRDGTLAGPHEL